MQIHKILGCLGILLVISFQMNAQLAGPLKEGKTYMIIATHSNKALEIKSAPDITANGLQLQQNDSTAKINQLFSFRQLKGGYYQITALCSNKSLEVRNNSVRDHDTIQQNQFNGHDCQMFILVKNQSGTFNIINKNSGYGFDILGGNKALGNGIAVIQYQVYCAPNQTFRIVEVEPKQKL